ncbi:DUF397 domain-containing protein [Streptomyces xinghaiensis]|uniref:DUF397 domain-containing protein n=1 Tax=Streptomyces xinghaiensis TaxID=1038928 RepID=UPI0037A5CCE5
MNQLNWKRSSFCGGGGNNCVEIAVCDQVSTAIRDSSHPVCTIRLSRTALNSFISSVRSKTLTPSPTSRS